MKEKGFTILLVEQNFRFAATVADRFYVVEHGQVDVAHFEGGGEGEDDELEQGRRDQRDPALGIP